MRVRPVSPRGLVEEIADRIAAFPPGRWVRVAMDGAPAAGPDAWASAVVDALPVRGRAALWIRSTDFLRPASLRLEFGRTDPDAFYEGWLDEAGLRREVLDRLVPGGVGTVLPSLWDVDNDRATRTTYVAVPPGAAVVVSGPLLLGGGLPFDLSFHFSMSAAALARRMPAPLGWTLPAYGRYEEQVDPAGCADVTVRVDDPRHPAVVEAA